MDPPKLTLGITTVILSIMKTAISIPDPVFEAADKLAQRLGVSRSELYATAVTAYVESHRDDHITARLNEIYSTEDSSLDPFLQQLQAVSLPAEDW